MSHTYRPNLLADMIDLLASNKIALFSIRQVGIVGLSALPSDDNDLLFVGNILCISSQRTQTLLFGQRVSMANISRLNFTSQPQVSACRVCASSARKAFLRLDKVLNLM